MKKQRKVTLIKLERGCVVKHRGTGPPLRVTDVEIYTLPGGLMTDRLTEILVTAKPPESTMVPQAPPEIALKPVTDMYLHFELVEEAKWQK